jgi:alpha-L-rhamnosidase
MVPAVQIVGTLHPVKITQPKSGVYIFDFGINFSGWEKLQVKGPAGTKVTMTPGELLTSSGTISQATVNAPFYETYILAGSGTEVWHPDFDFHGFRYVQVTGLPATPTTSTLTGLQLNTANASAGTFSSGNSLLNSIHQIVNQAIQNNMGNLLSDCPDREKLGWLEQDHLEFGSVSRAYDVAAYYREFFRNMADGQLANGLVPDNVPKYTIFGGSFRDDPNWGSTLIISAWQLYQTYGDTQTLKSYYANMQRYLAYLQSKASGNLLNYGLGDWGTLDTTTPIGVTSTYPYYQDAVAMNEIATVLGHTNDAATYKTLAQQIASAFNTKYLAAAHNTYANGTEAADALALDMGIVPSQYQQAVVQHLVNTIQANGNHVNVGEVALPAVFRALANGGRNDVVYAVATQTTYPSYGYEVLNGATSLLEFWNGTNGKNSQDHFMLGAINEWFSNQAGGLQPDPTAVGYNKLVIHPAVVGNLNQATSTYNTPYGLASSSWTRSGSTVQLQVQIPVNTTATVIMPIKSGSTVYHVGSGSYTFSSSLS